MPHWCLCVCLSAGNGVSVIVLGCILSTGYKKSPSQNDLHTVRRYKPIANRCGHWKLTKHTLHQKERGPIQAVRMVNCRQNGAVHMGICLRTGERPSGALLTLVGAVLDIATSPCCLSR
jgi:hypothetical protein